jgi:SNF2 family DNA or RNA helicase
MIEPLPSGRAAVSAKGITAAQHAALTDAPGQYYSTKNGVFTFDPSPLALHGLAETGLELEDSLQKQSDRWANFVNWKAGPRIPTDASSVLKTTPWAHQAGGIEYALNCPSPYLNMGMGTGKSLSTIGAFAGARHKKILILCPKSVVDVWPKQFRIHTHEDSFNVVSLPDVPTKKKVEIARRALAYGHRSTVVITNYEAAIQRDLHSWLKTIKWDAISCDEIHKIKSCSGKASRMAHSLSTGHPIGLSGTMLPHDPLDAWAQFRFLEPAIFGTSFMRFKKRYAYLGQFNEPLRWLNLEELADRINLITYKVSSDVLSLPGITHKEYRFRLAPKTMKFYNKFHKDLIAEYGNGTVVADNQLVKSIRLQQLTSGFFKDDETGDLIQLDDQSKLDAFKDWFDAVPKNEPIVVFARFKQDVDLLKDFLIKAGRLYGELSSRANDLVESAYPPHLNALVVNIASGGVGIDLSHACHGCYYSITYNGGDFEQSIARMYRPGQTRKVHMAYLVAEDTIDPDIYEALSENRDLANLVLNVLAKGKR